MKNLDKINNLFERDPEHNHIGDEATKLSNQALLTFVGGLLFYSFSKATDKKTLRTDCVRHMSLLDKADGVSREDLPKGLRARAEAAILRQVAL